ncbi:rab7 family, partial [Nannochloropsis oceanica]
MATQRSGAKGMDLYRRVPADLTETTSLGGLFSIVAGVFMAILCVVEIISFMSHTTETMVVLDQSHDQMIRINFNITMLDLPCRFAVVDVLDVLGTNRMNITKNIEKWNLDEEGRRRFFQGRNREEREILHDDHHAELEVLLQNGEHAIPLTADSFDEYMQANEFTFVSFYAP